MSGGAASGSGFSPENEKKGLSDRIAFCLSILCDHARSTLPDLRHAVHTCILLEPPFTLHFTLLTLEFQIRLDFLLEWLTLFPK